MPKFRREIFIVMKLGEIGIFRMHERIKSHGKNISNILETFKA